MMKVILINGSPREKGTTAFALGIIAEVLESEGISAEIITIGNRSICGCIGCGGCSDAGKCIIDDELNEIAFKMREADGMVIGSPVYYAGINGTLKCFLDRAFYSSAKYFRFKPAAGMVAMRRAGGPAALQPVNQYFEFAEMLITPTVYWSGIHGMSGEQAQNDGEGVQMMEIIGRNMAYLLKMKASCKLPEPPLPEKVRTNFIR
jgi:multimeric flavodoxin WrbA